MDNFDWKKWRSEGLGASDAPVVMGVSPYKTPYRLWEEKTGLITPSDEGNWATRRGHELEPKARAHYELLFGIEMPVAFVEHRDFSFIRASLDGWNEKERRILEIKCPGKEDHEAAVSGRVPEKYWPQVQHQLFVTGAERCDYFSYDGENGVVVQVAPDMEYIEKLVENLVEFWGLVTKKEPPPLSDRDYKKVTDPDLKKLLDAYAERYSESKKIDEEMKLLKEMILTKTTHPNMVHGSTKIYRSFRIGNVDYSKIPELKSVDLDAYRKPGNFFYTIKVSGE